MRAKKKAAARAAKLAENSRLAVEAKAIAESAEEAEDEKAEVEDSSTDTDTDTDSYLDDSYPTTTPWTPEEPDFYNSSPVPSYSNPYFNPLAQLLMATNNEDREYIYQHIPPNQQRYARACMVCSIIMTQATFRRDGCPNCPFLELKNSPDQIESCTSSVFEGTMAVADPRRSWLARWQRVDNCVPGVYAIKVSGTLPEDVKQAMADENHPYVARDGSAQEQD